MVARKKPRISKKPTSPVTNINPDKWVTQGGIDPEATPPIPTPIEDTNAKKDKGMFPHRISFDVETTQYKRLKYAAFDSSRAMNEILREAAEDWMASRGY